MSHPPGSSYSAAGVNIEDEEVGLHRLTERLRRTWPAAGLPGAVQLDFGHYANVVEFAGHGLAISTDGVGSKVLIAQMMHRYDTIGVDCIAMNVNDLLCVGARPVSLVDYIAVEEANPDLIDALSRGLADGAAASRASIVGGEIAQMRDVIRGVRPGYGFDLAATAVGSVDLDKIIVGRALRPGDVIVGLASSGVHSNGLTLARKVLLSGEDAYSLDWRVPGTEVGLGEALLKPTEIYVEEIIELLDSGIEVHGLAHITSDGFLNLARLDAPVGYEIDALPEIPPIFRAIQDAGRVSDEEMCYVYNMGIGFCVMAPPSAVNQVMDVMGKHGRQAWPIGRVTEDPDRKVLLPGFGLIGQGKRFAKA